MGVEREQISVWFGFGLVPKHLLPNFRGDVRPTFILSFFCLFVFYIHRVGMGGWNCRQAFVNGTKSINLCLLGLM